MTSKKSVTFLTYFFFVNVAKNIGDNSVPINNEHPSLLKIQENLTVQSVLNFKPVDEDFVSKQIGRLNVKRQQVMMEFRQRY